MSKIMEGLSKVGRGLSDLIKNNPFTAGGLVLGAGLLSAGFAVPAAAVAVAGFAINQTGLGYWALTKLENLKNGKEKSKYEYMFAVLKNRVFKLLTNVIDALNKNTQTKGKEMKNVAEKSGKEAFGKDDALKVSSAAKAKALTEPEADKIKAVAEKMKTADNIGNLSAAGKNAVKPIAKGAAKPFVPMKGRSITHD